MSYFNGGDALHGYVRASYGFPQSDGCVEMPPANAAVVWPMTPIGTLVTVQYVQLTALARIASSAAAASIAACSINGWTSPSSRRLSPGLRGAASSTGTSGTAKT